MREYLLEPPRPVDDVVVTVDGTRTFPSADGVVKIRRNSQFSISCSSAGRPKPTAYFLEDGERQQSGGRYNITLADDGSQVQLSGVVAGDREAGLFTCVFENPGGSSSFPVSLDVAGELVVL